MTTFAISGSSSARFVQSSDIGQLEDQLSAALQQLSAQSLLVTSLSLAGAGDGSNFGVLIEAATEESITGGTGIRPDELRPRLYVASSPEELLKQRAAVVLVSPPAGFPVVVDTQAAGTTKGIRFAGMALFALAAVNPIDTPSKELSEPNWYASVNGKDTNDGLTAATAVRTFDNLTLRKWGPAPRFVTNTILHVEGDFSDQDLILVAASADDGVSVASVGEATETLTGTLTGVTDYNSGADNTSLITDTDITDWSPHIGDRITLTSGANAGAMNWIAADLGGGQARLDTWFTLAPVGEATGDVVTAFGLTASVGDTYKVERFNSIRSMNVNIARPGNSLNPLNAFDLRDLALGGYVSDSDYDSTFGNQTTIAGCVVSSLVKDSNNLVFAGCRGQDLFVIFSKNVFFDSCTFLGFTLFNTVRALFLRKQILFQGTAPFLVSTQLSTAQEIAIFDSGSSFFCGRDSFVTLGALVFGSGNTATPFTAKVGTTILSLVLPTLQSSAVDDVDIEGNLFLYADLPQYITIKNAGMIT